MNNFPPYPDLTSHMASAIVFLEKQVEKGIAYDIAQKATWEAYNFNTDALKSELVNRHYFA